MAELEPLTAVAHAYGNLIVAFRRAHLDRNMTLASRIDAAILLFQEMWPEECASWDAQFSTSEDKRSK